MILTLDTVIYTKQFFMFYYFNFFFIYFLFTKSMINSNNQDRKTIIKEWNNIGTFLDKFFCLQIVDKLYFKTSLTFL